MFGCRPYKRDAEGSHQIWLPPEPSFSIEVRSNVQSAGKWQVEKLASAVLTGPLRLFGKLRSLFVSGCVGIASLQTLWHPLADDVHQSLKRLLHIDVVFGTGFKKLKACKSREMLLLHSNRTNKAWETSTVVSKSYFAYLAVRTAVFLYLKRLLCHLPCHIYFLPKALEHCPMNMSWSVWTWDQS